MNILLTGGTGLIGSQLGITLARLGHDITALTRKGHAADLSFPATCVAWDHRSLIPANILRPGGGHFDAVIHLAGEPVAQRWTKEAKNRIYESRIASTKALITTVASLDQRPSTWLNASAIGIYGDTDQKNLTEASPGGKGFLADVCRDWESALSELDHGIRRVSLRFGIILSSEGGALIKMTEPFRYGLGGVIGDGTQMMSWIHIDDAVTAIIHTLNRPDLTGPVNLVAPRSSSNRDFTRTLAGALKRPAFLPVPKSILNIVLGKMSQIVTSSADVRPERLLSSGFNYKFPDLAAALSALLGPQAQAGVRAFVARQWMPGSPAELFPFFSAADNLERITPPWLHFRIVGKSTPHMTVGSLIDYKLRIKGLPIHWRTRIATWNPPKEFSDEQLRGPYKIWHHTHTFESLGLGTLMTDHVLYKMRFWPFGDVAIPMVKKDIETIFSYRKKHLSETFTSTQR